MPSTQFAIRLPDWLIEDLDHSPPQGNTLESRMDLVIRWARDNVARETGGPFAAGIFCASTGQLVSAGVNLVVSSGLSLAHAEMVAVALAQRECGTYNLASHDLQLVTSAEPCWMCLGAIHWSGLRAVACAARDEDVRAIGFDEGHKPGDWSAEFARQGIQVTRDLRRLEACEVLREYRTRGGPIYNAGTN